VTEIDLEELLTATDQHVVDELERMPKVIDMIWVRVSSCRGRCYTAATWWELPLTTSV
jgi:hypothetical protein